MSRPLRIRPTAWIVRDDRVLLVKYDDWSGIHYNLPGGGIQPSETIVEGVAREVLEECGVPCNVGNHQLTVEYWPQKDEPELCIVPTLLFVFAATLLGEPSLPQTPDDYQIGLEWLPIEALESVDLRPPIQTVLIDLFHGKTVSNLCLDLRGT